MEFSSRELRDLVVAWLVLGVAFTVFLQPGVLDAILGQSSGLPIGAAFETFVISLLTVGVGFLLHELAHKVVAVRFGQVAEFRADYNMLFVTVMGALVGFLFAAPGAVHHRGRITERENGLIAVAGPITNIVLAVVFLGVTIIGLTGLSGFTLDVGFRGLQINLLLAGFNMIPFGPLDGRKVLQWNKLAYAAVALPSIGLAVLVFLGPI